MKENMRCVQMNHVHSGGSRIFQIAKGGAPSCYLANFPQNCIKMKKIGPRGGRGASLPPSPPNPLIMYNTALTAASEQVQHNVALHILLIHLKERKQNELERRIARKVFEVEKLGTKINRKHVSDQLPFLGLFNTAAFIAAHIFPSIFNIEIRSVRIMHDVYIIVLCRYLNNWQTLYIFYQCSHLECCASITIDIFAATSIIKYFSTVYKYSVISCLVLANQVH